MKPLLNAISLALLLASAQCAGQPSQETAGRWSARIADSFLDRHPGAVTYDSGSPNRRWNYEQGLMLVALCRMWQHSGDEKYFNFVRENLDHYIGADGGIATYVRTDFNLDNILPGRAALCVYERSRESRFHAAADTLREQLRHQPRTQEGGFWHKKIYPSQMWLDGLYMAEPFYARYASMFGEDSAYNDIALQFRLVNRHTRDLRTGLYFHGWDETKGERWANSETGCSASLWGRSMGWYGMALVDVLDALPRDARQRGELIAIVRELAQAIVRYRDPQHGLWYQVVDQGAASGNYLESSASSMFVYFLAKGARMGYLDKNYLSIAEASFREILQQFCTVDASGHIDLHGTCGSAGLGGMPYRDGSFAYYTGIPQRTNDERGIGALLCAAIELEQDSLMTAGKGMQ